MKIHSIIDVITNSSTEIYTFTSEKSIELAFDLLNEILKISGSEKKAEDLFEVKRIPANIEYITEKILEDEEEIDDEKLNEFKKEYDSKNNWDDKNIIEEQVSEYLLETELWKKYEDYDYDSMSMSETTLTIVSKDKSISDKNIFDMFFSLISQEASF